MEPAEGQQGHVHHGELGPQGDGGASDGGQGELQLGSDVCTMPPPSTQVLDILPN